MTNHTGYAIINTERGERNPKQREVITMTNTTLMNRARNIMINTRMEKLVATNVKRNGYTFEQAMLLVFFREIMPTENNIPENLVYTTADNRRFVLVADYNSYKRF